MGKVGQIIEKGHHQRHVSKKANGPAYDKLAPLADHCRKRTETKGKGRRISKRGNGRPDKIEGDILESDHRPARGSME